MRLNRLGIAAVLGVALACEVSPRKPAPRREAPAVEAPIPTRPLRLGRPPHLLDTRAEYQPLADHLGQVVGHPFTVVVADSYEQVVDELVAGELDFALLTPFIYVQAMERLPELRLVVSLLGEGASKYLGYIVVPVDSNLDSVDQLKGKRFAFVDRGSASGFLFPAALLYDRGLAYDRDFAEVRFAGSHARVVEWLLAGQVDAGAISSTTFVHLKAQGIGAKLNVVAKTDWIPFDAFVAQPGLPLGLVEAVRSALLQLSVRTEEGRRILTHTTTTSGFVNADDATYDGVRRVAGALRGVNGLSQKTTTSHSASPR